MSGRPKDDWSEETNVDATGNAEGRAPAPEANIFPLSAKDPRLRKLKALDVAPGPRRRRGFPTWLLFVAMGGVVVYLEWNNIARVLKRGTPAATPMRVVVAEKTTRADTKVTAAGFVAPRELVTIGTTVSGRVGEVAVTPGSVVTRGQLLVKLDDSELRAELALAAARFRDKQQNVSRLAALVKADVAPRAELQRARSELAISRAEMATYYPKLKQMRIVAPTDGAVMEVLTKPGEVLTVGTTSVGVVKLAGLSRLGMEADVNESDITRVRAGDRAEVTIDPLPNVKFHGTVREIAQQGDRSKGTFKVKVDLDPEPRLRPNMSAKVSFLGSGAPVPRLLIPREALSGEALWVVVDGHAQRRAVKFQSAGAMIDVTEGLKDGERVVLDAAGRTLIEGDAVPVTP